jgi:ubiquinone/menaquinone biosynthesis C-methylase UbiE
MSAHLPVLVDDVTTQVEDNSSSTRRIYDAAAPFYTVSARLFHRHAHLAALAAASVRNGTNVLELATGSGEMFTRLLDVNRDGQTVGVDLSPKMAARTQGLARRKYPRSCAHCYAADARSLPFPGGSFDSVFCCYLFELLPPDHVPECLKELRRVLRHGGRLTVILVSQTKPGFNAAYRFGSKILPAFWGRQIDEQLVKLLPEHGFELHNDSYVTQIFYVSHIVSASAAAVRLNQRPKRGQIK